MSDDFERCNHCGIELTRRNSGDSDDKECNECYWSEGSPEPAE